MTFKIERTSDPILNPGKPCDRAYSKRVVSYQKTDRVRDVDGRFINQATLVYKNQWFIEIESLQDLLDLVKEVGNDLIIGENSIEIYDGYRE